MDSQAEISHIPMQVTGGCLVASIQQDLTTMVLRRFQQDLLERIRSTGVSGVILDVSGVEIMDVDDFELLRRSMAMASVMGARPMLVGLRPGIVASLIALDADIDGVEAAADVDDALRRLQRVADDGAPAADDSGRLTDEHMSGGENGYEGSQGSHRDQI